MELWWFFNISLNNLFKWQLHCRSIYTLSCSCDAILMRCRMHTSFSKDSCVNVKFRAILLSSLSSSCTELQLFFLCREKGLNDLHVRLYLTHVLINRIYHINVKISLCNTACYSWNLDLIGWGLLNWSLRFGKFRSFKITHVILWITSIFDRCHRSWDITCQIWMSYSTGNEYFDDSEKVW